jgi:hypothetical protein
MDKKKIKRKIIGFMAGEKGSIGKLQALGLGITGLIVSGLFVPEEAQAGAHSNAYGESLPIDEYGTHHSDWCNTGWDYHEEGGATTYRAWDNEGGINWSHIVYPIPDEDAHNNYADHEDYSDWNNIPPDVKIEVK